MPDILLAGAYGQANPGDEALLEAFLGAIGHTEVVVTSKDPAATEHRFGCAAMAPTGTNVLRWLHDGRHLVIGGGTIFKALHPSSGRRPRSLLLRTHALVRAAKLRGITVSLVGVGAADLPGALARRVTRSIARHADLLVVRDEASAAVLATAGAATPIRVGADPAWTLFDPPPLGLRGVRSPSSLDPVPTDRPRRVLVALSHLAGGRDLAPNLATALDELDPSGASIHLQPWQPDEHGLDHQLGRELLTRLGPHARLIEPPVDIQAAATEAANHDLVVGLRFHALVAAAVAGRPFVAIAHEQKLAALATRFDQLSVPAHASPQVLARTIAQAAARPAPDRAVVIDDIARAAEAFRLLRLVLSDGATADDEPQVRLAFSNGSVAW